MAAAPVILTSEELATREARNVVMVSSEEILPRRIPAYVQTESEISFMFRQPSASAILINKPFIELELQFKVSKKTGTDIQLGLQRNANSATGRVMEGLPFLCKCVRTSVVSINGATQTYRNSEYLTSYIRSQVSRDAMRKINKPFNSMDEGLLTSATGSYAAEHKTYSKSDSEQAREFITELTKCGTAPVDAADAAEITLPPVTIREPLFMSVFGGLQGNDSFPLWSCEQNKSPSLLHVQQCTINFNLLDNWVQNLCGLYACSNNAQGLITGVEINKAHLCCTYVQPPPKYIASALASNVTYASYKMLRFESTKTNAPLEGGHAILGPVNSLVTDCNDNPLVCEWTLEAVSFQYMPSTFIIEIAPDYNCKCNLVNAANANLSKVEAKKRSMEDRRMGIVEIDFIINTSPDVAPSHGTSDFGANITHLRYNSRQLYEMYLKNCASVERAVYTYDEWFYGGCVVLMSPQDMNGILPSQHIRGNVSIQGTIKAVNTLGYGVYVGGASPPVSLGDFANEKQAWYQGVKFEKYRAQITGVYSNCYIALDAKSGLVGENVLSEQFGNSLRLSAV